MAEIRKKPVHPSTLKPTVIHVGESWGLRQLWLRALRTQNRSKATLESYKWATTKFLIWCDDEHLEIRDVRHGHINAWLDSRPIGPRSRYAYTSIIATFFGWLEREEILPLNPAIRVDRPTLGRYLPRPAATATIHAGLDACAPRTVAMIACGALEGMRRIEISRLRVEDLLWNLKPAMVLIHGKGNKERLVPLHDATVLALRTFGLPVQGWVFPSPYGGSLTPAYVGRLITLGLLDLGAEHRRVTPHQLRHWFGTEVYRASLDLRLTGELMGHANPSSTAIYTAFHQPKAAEIVGGLPSRALPAPRESGEEEPSGQEAA